MTAELPARTAKQFAARRFGLTARVITDRYARQKGLPSTAGVLITGVLGGGPGATGGLQRGDIILKLGRAEVKDLETFTRIYRELVKSGKKTVLVSVRRGGQSMFRTLSPSTRDDEEEEE